MVWEVKDMALHSGLLSDLCWITALKPKEDAPLSINIRVIKCKKWNVSQYIFNLWEGFTLIWSPRVYVFGTEYIVQLKASSYQGMN